VSFVPDTSPEVLEWARKVIGLPQRVAAEKLGIPGIQLREWEEGYGGPTLGQLRKMAEIYKKPLATLLRSQLPKNEKPIEVDFRLLEMNQNREWSTELWMALWRIQLQQDVALELAHKEDAIPPLLGMTIYQEDHLEETAISIRAWLESAAGKPVNLYGKRDFSEWIKLIEAQGILVTQVSFVSLEEMRGCSFAQQPFPVIALNSQDSPNGRLFTLMHELIHILLQDGGICDLEDKYQEKPLGRERTERFCNAVAAAILIPSPQLLKDLRVAISSTHSMWAEEDISELSRRFGVSREALILRLISLGRAPWTTYHELQPRYQRAWEEVSRLPNTSHRFAPNQRKIRDLGRRYSISVLNAYRRDDITALNAADFLNTTIGNLPKLSDELEIPR